MNRRIVLVISLAANLGWLVVFVWLQTRDVETRTTTVTGPEEVATADAPGSATTTEISVEPPRIDVERWADLERVELDQFKTNLEAVGCPPQTMHDILTAVMEQDYLRRRAALVEPFQQDTWHKLVRPDEFKEQYDTARVEVLKLWQEFWNEHTELLGKRSPLDVEVERAVERRRIWLEHGDLPEEKVERVLALRLAQPTQFAAVQTEADARLEEGEDGRTVAAETADKFRRVRVNHSEAIKTLLSEEEQTEWRLRQNGAASWAANSVAFEPTREELRAVAAMIDEVKRGLWERDGARHGKRDAEEMAIDLVHLRNEEFSEIGQRRRELLGPDRHAEFQRGQDTRYQQLVAIADRLGLPRSTAAAAYAARREVLSQPWPIPAGVPIEQVVEQSRAALQLRIKEAVRSVVGEDVLEAYRQHGAEWIDGM